MGCHTRCPGRLYIPAKLLHDEVASTACIQEANLSKIPSAFPMVGGCSMREFQEFTCITAGQDGTSVLGLPVGGLDADLAPGSSKIEPAWL